MGSPGDVLTGQCGSWSRLLTVVALVGAVVVVVPDRAWGCSCEELSDAEAERTSKIVFAGTLADSRRAGETHTYLFEVDTVVKGDVPVRVLMTNNVDESNSCSEALDDGKRYLVYGDDVDDLEHNLCSPTNVIGDRTVAGAEPEPGGDTLPPDYRRWALYVLVSLGVVAYFVRRRFFSDPLKD